MISKKSVAVGQTKHIGNSLSLLSYVPSVGDIFCDFFKVYYTKGYRVTLECVLDGCFCRWLNDLCRFLLFNTLTVLRIVLE